MSRSTTVHKKFRARRRSTRTSGRTRRKGPCRWSLADYIRSLGYHAQVHSHSDSSAPYIPMFINAGLGQLGANGQLLMPHFGSRGTADDDYDGRARPV